MKVYQTNEIKNIALLGNDGSGKTTLTEALLYEAGLIKRRGRITAKNTVSDYFPVEQEYGYSVFSTVFHVEWNGKKLNIIDCPGSDDFVGVGTQNHFRYTEKLGKPVIFLVNQLDDEKCDYDAILEQLTSIYGNKVVPVQYPVKTGPDFNALIDVLLMKKYSWGPEGGAPTIEEIPEEEKEKAMELHKALVEAAAENGKELIVLDRPNPLGGNRVEGCPVETGYTSFVSQYPIPYIYGLTCGELARLLNGEGMTGTKPCKLTVVAMEGWTRDMDFADTGLPWVAPSPHIPQAISAYYYPMSGIAGELGTLSIGVGYTLPFELFGASWVDADTLADRLNALKLEGVIFRPIHYTPFYGTQKGSRLQGVQVHLVDRKTARLTEIQFYVMQEMAALYPSHKPFATAEESRLKMVDKVCGSNKIRQQFTRRYRWEDARPYWENGVKKFKQKSQTYYIYK